MKNATFSTFTLCAILFAAPAFAEPEQDAHHAEHDHKSHDHDAHDHGSHEHGEDHHADHGDSHDEMKADAKAEGEIITAHVKGLVCDFCAQAVTKVFKREDAVQTVHVDLDSGTIKVGLKKDGVLDDAKMKKLIRNSGYSLTKIERSAG